MEPVSFVYLDDGLASQLDQLSVLAASSIQQQDLKSCGLLCNEKRSHWTPMQVGGWSGFFINTVSMQFPVCLTRRERSLSLLNVAFGDGSVSSQQLAEIAASVISLSLAVGPSCCLFIGQIYYAMESRSSEWDQIIPLLPALLEEPRL